MVAHSPNTLALIPAFSQGEVESPLCLRNLAGYPLITYTIAAGRQAREVSRVVVVTDSEPIAAVSEEYQAEVWKISPEVGKGTKTWILSHLPDQWEEELIAWLEPAAPARPQGSLDAAIRFLQETPGAGQVGSFTKVENFNLWKKKEPLQPELQPVHQDDQQELFRSTAHLMIFRAAGLRDGSFEVACPLPYLIPASYDIELTAPWGWQAAEWALHSAELDLIRPGSPPRPLPKKISLLVMDFDGVLTDNRVWVDQDGREQISANRSDSLGLYMLQEKGIATLVISMETNPVVSARCRKIKVPVLQGIGDKAATLGRYLTERNIDPAQVVYIGNDVNDVPCFRLVGCAVVVADAQPVARRAADLVLTRRGGYGAVRELCDLILSQPDFSDLAEN